MGKRTRTRARREVRRALPYGDIDGATVTADATLDSLGIDSLDMVEFTCDIEERCEIEFEQPESIVTVADLVAHIDSLK